MQRQRVSPGARRVLSAMHSADGESARPMEVIAARPGEDPEYRADLEWRIDQAIKRIEAISTIGVGHLVWKLERRGDWLWLLGNTWPIRQQLKLAGFDYSKSHTQDAQRERNDRSAGVWIWKPEEYGKWKRRSHTDDEVIKAKYGSHEVL